MIRLATSASLVLTAVAVAVPASAAAAAPSVSGTTAANVSSSGATLKASVNARGNPTSYYFQYGKTTSYGTRTPTGDAGSGTSSTPVNATIAGLQPLTTYHFQVVAFSPSGTTRGPDHVFKTLQIPTTSSIAAGPNPVVFGGLVTVSGFLSGPDVGGKAVALQANPFPFLGGFQQLGNTVLTTPQGGYVFLVPPTVNAQLRVIDKDKPSVVSPVIVENVGLKVSLKARRGSKSHGSTRVKFSGLVSPAKIGNAVVLQQATRRGWRSLGGVTLTKAKTIASSGFARTVRLRQGGTFRVVVKTAGGDYADGASRTVHVVLH